MTCQRIVLSVKCLASELVVSKTSSYQLIQRRLSMLGHVSGMSPVTDTYRTLFDNIALDWRRPKSRPRFT